MSKLIAILTISLLAGCYGSQLSQLQRDNSALQEQNRRLWAKLGKGDGSGQDGQAPSPAAGGYSGGGQQVSTGAMVARQKHGVYMGTTGGQSRQATMGPKLMLVNHVCDRGSRNEWSQCGDRDRSGSPDYNTYLAFQVDGQPVVCDSPFVHPDTGEVLLPPGETCYVELGRSSIVNLTVKAYRNFGTSASIMLDAAPDASTYRTVDIGTLSNTGYYEIDESRF